MSFLDIGASSYSVTIVAFEPGKLIVKTSQHDSDLGGRNFDEVVAEWICEEFTRKFENKLSGNPRKNKKVWLKLLSAAEKAKKTLSPSGVKEARVNLECLMDDLDFNVRLTSEQFNELCEPLLLRLEPPISRALSESSLSLVDVTSVEIVGGGTRVASVK
jgi:heat shock protein 4